MENNSPSVREPVLTPRLIVSSAAEAIEFYQAVFEAEELERYATPSGLVVHAALSIDGAMFSLAEAHKDWFPSQRPEGSPVLLRLTCKDPDATAKRAEDNGGTIIIPVADRSYGFREGRIQDPFGHLWIVSRLIRKLSPEEIQDGINALEEPSEG